MITPANILACLALLSVAYGLWDEFQKRPRSLYKIVIGIFLGIVILFVTIYKNIADDKIAKTNAQKTDIQFSSLLKKMAIDSVYLYRLDSLGLHRDSLHNRPIISKTFINNINYLVHYDNYNEKLNQAFQDLKSAENLKKEMATEYIIQNFPSKISESQIQDIINANPINASLDAQQGKLLYLLTSQGKSSYIVNYCKQVLLYDETNSIAWHYLLRKEVNIDFEYISSKIKSRPNYCIKYGNITQYAMDVNNEKRCLELLNSRDLVNFLVNDTSETSYLKQGRDWIIKMIDRKPSYSKYKDTYFFKATR